VVRRLLTAPHDPCHLRHFRDRIHGYYPGDEKSVLALLDHAAQCASPLGQAELMNVAKTAGIHSLTRRTGLTLYKPM
jgi:hypothetical protein